MNISMLPLSLLVPAATVLLLAWTPALRGADIRAEYHAAAALVAPIQEQLDALLVDGRMATANARLLDLFPQAGRTPAQSWYLGNLLYGMDAKASYALHQDAAKRQPDEEAFQLEWALEQHRAGEYAGALRTYDAISKSSPENAPVHGLAAECLIRLSKNRQAAERWLLSEKAKRGSLTDLESLVYAVHGDASQFSQRAALIAQMRTGIIDAAMKLVALDCTYEHDWWNYVPQPTSLKHDLELIAPLRGARILAARCLGEGYLLEKPEAKDISALLSRDGLLIDGAHTLPSDPALCKGLIQLAISTTVITREQAREWLLARLHAQAKGSTDATLWNLVAFLQQSDHEHDPALHALEKEAWEACGDARFAVGWLTSLPKNEKIRVDDPFLATPMAKCPENSILLGLAIAAGAPSAALLVQGIKAEYHHFSALDPVGRMNGRISARTLSSYFAQLAKFPDLDVAH